MTNPFGIHDAWLPVLQVTLSPAPGLQVGPVTGTRVTVKNTVTGAWLTADLDTVTSDYTETDTLAGYLDEARWFHADLMEAIRFLCQEPQVLDYSATRQALFDRITNLTLLATDLRKAGEDND